MAVPEFISKRNDMHGCSPSFLTPPLLSCRERARRNGASEDSAPASSSGVSSDLSDLSDFCLQPTDDMDEDEQRVLQEEQDAVSLCSVHPLFM